jgi:hypothetical protein
MPKKLKKLKELEELRKKLYKPESKFRERLETPEMFRAGEETEKISSEKFSQEVPRKKLSEKQKEYLRWVLVSSGAVFLIVVGFMIWHGLTSFDKDKVILRIQGSDGIASGDEVTYIVKYKNETRLTLEDVKLVFHYPEGSIPTDTENLTETCELPNLKPGQENQVEFPAIVIGLKKENRNVRAELSYRPGKISSRFANQAEFSTEIISVPLTVDLEMPEKLVSGQSFNFIIRYSNESRTIFDNLQIRIDYPDGFNLTSSDPDPLEEGRIWQIGELRAKDDGEIFIKGSVQGEQNEMKSFKAQIGILENDQFIGYSEIVDSFKISASPLFISQTVNGSKEYIAKAGEILKYQIDYQNTTNVGIKNVVITAKLEGDALDLTKLKLEGASFDGTSQTIVWNAGNVPQLAFLDHYQKGKLYFLVNVKEPLPIQEYADKNFSIINEVKIDSSETPDVLKDIQISGQSKMTTKVASQLSIQAEGYFNDDLISNSGPIPPKVGQTTTYTIKWRMTNTANDLNDVEVKAFLPPHVHWNNKIVPADSDLKYNSQTGQVVWKVGDLPSATGILLPARQTAFQISVTPGTAHLGKSMELIGQSTATGYDSFVDLELSSSDIIIDTKLPDDLTLKQDGRVEE